MSSPTDYSPNEDSPGPNTVSHSEKTNGKASSYPSTQPAQSTPPKKKFDRSAFVSQTQPVTAPSETKQTKFPLRKPGSKLFFRVSPDLDSRMFADVIEGKPMAKPTMKSREPHDANWNPWTGCRKVSAACKNCLMFLTQRSRYENFGHQAIHDPSNIRRCKTTWRKPYKLQKQAEAIGRNLSCFVCGYSDFFIEEADNWREDAWRVIRETPSVVYQIQTKRTHRIAACLPPDWGDGYPNVWLGASVEMKKYFFRLDNLRAIPCKLRYADNLGMLEDLMPELEHQLDGIGWCIAGGETGCGVVDPRPWDPQWARNVRDVCATKNIPFWMGHVAGRARKLSYLLDGREYTGMPVISENMWARQY